MELVEVCQFVEITEGFLMVTGEQALMTNVIKSQIFHLPVSSLCFFVVQKIKLVII